MKKEIVKVLNDELKEEKFAEKVIDLCLWYQIEESKNMIEILGNEVKFYERKKSLILDNCKFRFQMKKAYKEMNEIDDKIFKLYEKIGEEVTIIEKIKNSIEGNIDADKNAIETTDNFFSYYDLLSFLKRGIEFKRVSLNAFDKKVMYIYDHEGNYVLEDRNDESPQFAFWLSECFSDNTKFGKNIKIIEK